MFTDELVKYGIPANVVDAWKASGLQKLLPIQAMAIKKYGLFGKKNLIISAPTSSGKTFVGEIAAIKMVEDKQKTFYLVPLKALAEEKWYEFKRKYAPYGYKIVISTRDHREFDEDIENGDFNIAIIVYEKLQQLVTRNIGLLSKIGLIIVDELQMISDPSRGADLEMLLTKLRMYQGEYKILGLSAVLKDCKTVPEWLNADFLEYFIRPVELRRGLLYEGKFHYEEFNTGESGTEDMIHVPDGKTLNIMIPNVLQIAKNGEQCLIFLKDKNATRTVAAAIAGSSSFPQAQDAIETLKHAEDTSSKENLIECLEHGVAFHNADMNFREREIIERHFRLGNIRILCSTSTLAMGVNLPVRNVFIEAETWHSNPITGRPDTRPLMKVEFENMAGRAGRLSHEKEFGRAIIVADRLIEFTSGMKKYIEGDLEALEPHFFSDDLATVILNLVASGICHSESEIQNFIKHSLSWFIVRQKQDMNVKELGRKLTEGLKRCIEYGLIKRSANGLETSKLGYVAAVKGISVDTARPLINWLRAVKTRSPREIEILYVAARTKNAKDYFINMATREQYECGYHTKINMLFDQCAKAMFSKMIDDPLERSYDAIKEMKVALVMHDWIQGVPVGEIEQKYNVTSGTVERVSGGISWIVDAIAGLAGVIDVDALQVKQYEKISRRLLFGVVEDGLPFAELRQKGLTRNHLSKLVGSGITDMDALKAVPLMSLSRIIPERLAKALLARVHKSEEPEVSAPEKAAQTTIDVVLATQAPKSDPIPIQQKTTFKCKDRFHFDGRVDKKRTHIVINGKQTSITNRSFEILLKMGVHIKKDGIGWVGKSDITSDNPAQYISRLRKEIEPFLHDSSVDILENDSFGAYRLSVPPENITFDVDVLPDHWMHGIRELSEEIAKFSAVS